MTTETGADGLTDYEHDRMINIEAAEADLHKWVDQAETAIRSAGLVLGSLVRGDAWHVEYAEGLAGDDAEHEVTVAWRAIRNLQRIVDQLSPERKDTDPR